MISTPPYNPYAGSSYNVNPSPQGGQGIFGGVPGPVSLPNPALDLSKVYPDLTKTNLAAQGAVGGELEGNVSPLTMDFFKDRSAEHAAGSGMPYAGFFDNDLLSKIGKYSLGQQNNGAADANSLTRATAGTETVSPGTQAALAMQNATMAAAPDPTTAAIVNLLSQLGGMGASSLMKSPGMTPSPSGAPIQYTYGMLPGGTAGYDPTMGGSNFGEMYDMPGSVNTPGNYGNYGDFNYAGLGGYG